jgi:hypothetical protein
VLQSQLPGAVLPKQTPIPDVPPHPPNRPMPSLVHSRRFRGSSNRGAGSGNGPKETARSTRVLGWRALRLRLRNFRRADARSLRRRLALEMVREHRDQKNNRDRHAQHIKQN